MIGDKEQTSHHCRPFTAESPHACAIPNFEVYKNLVYHGIPHSRKSNLNRGFLMAGGYPAITSCS